MTDEQADMICEADSVFAAAREAAGASERLSGLLCEFYAVHGERATADLFGVYGEQIRRTRRQGSLSLATGTVQRIAASEPDSGQLTQPPPRMWRRGRLSRAAHDAALADCEAALADGSWSLIGHARKHKVSTTAAAKHRRKVLQMLHEQQDAAEREQAS